MFNSLFSVAIWVSWYQKGFLDFTEVSGSSISWTICSFPSYCFVFMSAFSNDNARRKSRCHCAIDPKPVCSYCLIARRIVVHLFLFCFVFCFLIGLAVTTLSVAMPLVLWRFWLGGRKGIWPVKEREWWGAGVVVCSEDSGLHMAQLMPLSLASVKSRLVLPFWYRLTLVVLDKGSLHVCVYHCRLM